MRSPSPRSRRPLRARARLAALLAVLLAVPALLVALVPPATAAPPDDVRSAEQQVAALQAAVEDVAAQLSAATAALEQSQADLAASIAGSVAAERAVQASAARRAAAGEAVRRVVLARYTDPVPTGLRLLADGSARDVQDALATGVLLARVQGAGDQALRAAAEDEAQAVADEDTLAARRGQTSDLARRTEAQLAAVRDLADRTAAQLQAAHERLDGARTAAAAAAAREAAAREAAAQAAAAAAQAAGVPGVADGGPPCTGASTGSYANGFVDDAALCRLQTAPAHRLQADAARAFDAMSRAHLAETGELLCLTDSYRSYAEQVRLFTVKPTLAAVPGTSNHGRGLAVDMCGGVERFDGAAHAWMDAHAAAFGWVHPAWAEPGGGRPEPWHWEYGRL